MGLIGLDLETLEFLGKLCSVWHLNDDTIYLSALAITTSLSLLFGIILVYRHRYDSCFLPIRSYISYMITAITWGIVIGACFDEFIPHKFGFGWQETCLLMWFLPLLAFLVPWAFFRSSKPTPLIIDATLVPIAAVLGGHAIFFLRSSYRQCAKVRYYFTGNSETIFLLTMIALCFLFFLRCSHLNVKRSRMNLIYVSIFISIILIFGIFAPSW